MFLKLQSKIIGLQDVTAALNENLEYLNKLKTVSTLSNEASYNLVGEFAE